MTARGGRSRVPKQSENEVTAACKNWLVKLGWRPHRNHCGTFFTERGQRITGEIPGTPDWMFTRPTERGHARMLYVEMKSSTGAPSKIQREMHALLRHYGYTVIVAGSLADLQEQVRSTYATD